MFIAPEHRALLAHNALVGFEQAWNFEVSWVEAPNDNRGGLSGVGRVSLLKPEGGSAHAFLKRQQNHTRRTWRYPLRGEATFTREFHMIRHLQQHGVPTLEPMLFAEHYISQSARAVLMTAALEGYQSLDEFAVSPEYRQLPLLEKRKLLRAVADTVKKMHAAGVQHRSLYAKHLFVKWDIEEYQVAVIDLEKSRINWLPWIRQFYDLVTLNYRTPGWSRADRLYFFKQYLGIKRLAYFHKIICRLIVNRSKNKRLQANNQESN